MDLKWEADSLNDLVQVVIYLKKNKSGEILEYLGNYFIRKHLKYFNIDDYSMDFSTECCQTVDITDVITEGEYKLAFICELASANSYKFNLILKEKKKLKQKKFINVYVSLSQMIKFSIYHNIKLSWKKSNYKTFYLISLVKDNLLPEISIKSNEDPILSILNFAYFLTSELISIDNKSENLIYSLTSCILETQNLDISILSKQSIRSLLEILNTKRTIFVRILLILSYELLKNPNILSSNLLIEKIDFQNFSEFVSVMSSPLIEVLVFLTANKIANKS